MSATTFANNAVRAADSTLALSPMEENLLTIKQVAKYLKVDKFTVYRLVSKNKLPAFKVGNQWRFKRATIDSWLEQNSNIRPRKSAR